MRILRFIVDGQTIKQDPTCDFNGLFPGRNPEIELEFIFSPEWDNVTKVLATFSILESEYEPQLIDEYDVCTIPAEALSLPAFKIQVLGRRGKTKLSTNKITIKQTGDRR